MLHEPGAALAGPQQPDEPRRVPRRAARQGPLLEQQHVGLAEVGQVVGRRRPHHSPADDDDRGPARAARCEPASRMPWHPSAAASPPAHPRRPGPAAARSAGSVASACAGSNLSMDHSQKSNVDAAHALLDHPPQGPAVARDEPPELSPGDEWSRRAGVDGGAVVGRAQVGEPFGAEARLGRRVAQLEGRLVHPRVLVVDDPQVSAVVEDVRGEQVVVAGHERLGMPGRRWPARARGDGSSAR